MFCPKCGKENPEGARVCSSCSSVLTITSAAPLPGAKTSGLAIASLVLGILAPLTCLLTLVPAVICGIIALIKINKSRGQMKGNGLAIAGIAIPVAALPIVAIILAILMPALAKTRQVANRLVCSANMTGLGKAMMVYANDYNDVYPTPSKWCDLLVEKAEVSPQSFQCKGAPNDGRCNYAMNKNVEKLGMSAPPDMVLLFETSSGWNQCGGPEILSTENHQGTGCNILYCDGHVSFESTKNLADLKWTADTPAVIAPDNFETP